MRVSSILLSYKRFRNIPHEIHGFPGGMASPSQPANPDLFPLSSFEEDVRPTTKALQHTDEKSGGPQDAQLSGHEETRPEKIGSKMMLVWIMVNTSATIAIVSITKPKQNVCQAESPILRSYSTKQSSKIHNSAKHN